MPALTIRLPQDADAALRDLAQAECRTPRDQAAFLVVQGLRAAAANAVTAEPRRGPRRRLAPRTSAAGAEAQP